MGNIIAFLARYYRFFLFVVLEAICFVLVVNYNQKQSSTFFSWTYDMSGRAHQAYSDVDQYFHLKVQSDSLIAENARLKAMLPNSKFADTAQSRKIDDTLYKQKYIYIPAAVVNNSTNIRNNYLTLDAGSHKGLTGHLGVVSTAGIVGITRFVSPNFSTVISVLHKDFNVQAQVVENGEKGTITWDGRRADMVILRDIPRHIKIEKGWHVVVSPYSEAFPKGTAIGTIADAELKEGDAFYTIHVRLASDIRNLNRVYVVNNLMKMEQDSLESATKLEEGD